MFQKVLECSRVRLFMRLLYFNFEYLDVLMDKSLAYVHIGHKFEPLES